MSRTILILLLVVSSFVLKAQVRPTQRKTNFTANKGEIVKLDTLSIVPQSVVVTGLTGTVDTSSYKVDFVNALFYWQNNSPANITVSYTVFPISFSKRYFNKDVKQLEQLPIDNSSYYIYKPLAVDNTLFTLQGLNKSGSISRGVMFGNNQNLSVNSNMVLQLSGKIANDIEIVAAISDDNLPIQPQGNTQQLNEFDRVFVQIKKDSTTLTAGDYELKKPDSYFMNFYKRTQGAMINHHLVTKDGVKSSTTVAMAVAKGRSARNQISGQEGNQGPYRLTGNNGENYIVVIAGTERVFIDGVAIIRGQDNDYVIDYNTAEITFTAKQLINLNSRISVEFEYSDKNYSRTLSYVNQRFDYDKFAFRLNYYNEKDNRNQPFLQTLGDEQKLFLQGIGSDISQAFYPNVTEVEFNESEVLYEKLTSLNGTDYYKYSIDPQLAKYRVGFSYVGEGQGDYRLNTSTTANGKVYEFVTPIAGVAQGNYQPITLLITPKQQQLITLAADFKPSVKTFVSTEFAISNNNVNLFADKEVANATGYGLKIAANHPVVLGKSGLKLNTMASYEHTSSTFAVIERYRSVEFNRDFNLSITASPATEDLLTASAQLFKSTSQNIGYELNTFSRANQYQGYLHKVTANYSLGKYTLRYDGSLLNADATTDKGSFSKQYLSLNRQIANLVTGFAFEQQHNNTANKLTDDLTGNSLHYNIYKIYLETRPQQLNKYKLSYSYREDKLPQSSALINSSNAQHIEIGLSLNKNVNSALNLTAGYRKTNYLNGFASVNSDENLVGRVDYNLNALKGLINTTMYYEVGSGQEPRRDVTYLEVVPGQGIYAWVDYNQNGIKELDEFEISKFPDQAKYIRIFTSSTTYVRTNFTGVNQSLRITPSAILKGNSSITKFINKLSNQLSYKIDRKILASNGFEAYNPFNVTIDANNLISMGSFLRNTLFFNKNNPKFGIDVNYLADGGKSFLSNGFDSRKKNETGIRLRTMPSRTTNINLLLNKGTRKFTSELFSQRSYLISYYEIAPEFNYQFSNDFRTSFSGIFAQLHNDVPQGDERNSNITFSTETRYNVLKKGVLTGRVSYIRNKFEGNVNSTVGYEMLSGLQTGNNFTWALGLQRSVGNGIQLNLNYDGRKSETVNVIHTGSMQVRAFF